MTSKQIECFISVAESLNFTQSAKKLYSSQSTVSRQISLLEEELGFELFIRGNNYIRLTPAGTTMLTYFTDQVNSFTIQRKIALTQNKGESGSLRFGFYCNMYIESFLMTIINDFHLKYPNIIISYECIPNGDLEARIKENKLDLIFIHDFDELDETEFVSNIVFYTNQFLLYGVAHPLANKENLKFEDFKDETFWNVSTRTSPKRHANMLSIFNYYGIDTWNSSVVSNFDTVLLNIRLGHGVAFVDPITHIINKEFYKTLPLPEEISRIGIATTWLRSNYNPVIPLFTNQFIDEVIQI